MIKKIVTITIGLVIVTCHSVCHAQNNPPDTQQMLQQIKQFQQVINQQKLTQNQPVVVHEPLPNNGNMVVPVENQMGTPVTIIAPPPVAAEPPPPTSSVSRQQRYGAYYQASKGRSMSMLKAPFSNARPSLNNQDTTLHNQAYKRTLQGLFPMTPEQIHRLRQLYTASQYAAAAPPGIPPKPTATSMQVDLSPGATPPSINLAEGDVTAVVFLDVTGAPWPIQAFDNGNPRDFDIQWNRKDNVLLIQATASFGRGNLAVRLRDLGPPIMISLITNNTVEAGGVVDYRVDMQVPGFGPNAVPPPVVGLPPEESPALLNFLDGVPPGGSKKLDFIGGVGQAWLLGNKVYIRTPLTLLSPAWTATIASADGTHVYEIQQTPLLLVSQNGKITQIKLEGL